MILNKLPECKDKDPTESPNPMGTENQLLAVCQGTVSVLHSTRKINGSENKYLLTEEPSVGFSCRSLTDLKIARPWVQVSLDLLYPASLPPCKELLSFQAVLYYKQCKVFKPLLLLQSPPQSMGHPPPATTCYAEERIRDREQNYLSLSSDIFFLTGTFDLALHPSSDLALAPFQPMD